MQNVYVYLKVNKATYDNDDKEIFFILSYLTGGDAAVWKHQFIQTKIEESEEEKTDKPNWGTYKEFIEALKKTFQPYDKPGEALEEMKKLRLGDGSITEHNSRFCLLVSQIGMKDPGANRSIPRNASLGLTEPDYSIRTPPENVGRMVHKGHKPLCLCWTSKGAMPL
jgi:Retrotransposon gag protein